MAVDQQTDMAHARLAASLVAHGLSQSTNAILKAGRGSADVAFARQVAMYAVYVGCGLSLARVAAAFGRDRSTVAHACHQIEDRRDDEAFDSWLDRLERVLKQAAGLSSKRWGKWSQRMQRLLRVLATGGTAIDYGTRYAVYRSCDLRRSVVGYLAYQDAEVWLSKKWVCREGDRLAWIGGDLADALSPERRPAYAGVGQDKTIVRETLLQKALNVSSDASSRLRLARAVKRFVGDTSLAERGQAVTMNWDLIARGRLQSSGQGPTGHTMRANYARRALEDVRHAVGKTVYDRLAAVLLHRISAREFARNSNCRPQKVPDRVHGLLCSLADAYDYEVRPLSRAD